MARRTFRVMAVIGLTTAFLLLLQGKIFMAASMTLCTVPMVRLGWF